MMTSWSPRIRCWSRFRALPTPVTACTRPIPSPRACGRPRTPPRYDSAFETADGSRRLVADLRLPAVPWAAQVQQLMTAHIREERRFRRHHIVLPPEAAVLEPLDAIAWTSGREGCPAKVFKVYEISDDLMTMSQSLGLRERDAADFEWTGGDVLPTPIARPGVTAPSARTVPGFAVSATVIYDPGGAARRTALVLSGTGEAADDARGLAYEVRVAATGVVVVHGSVLLASEGTATVTEGIRSGTGYEVRAQLVLDRATVWTDWLSVTTPDILTVDPGVIEAIAEGARVPVVATLPVDDTERGAIVYLVNASERRLYRWDYATSAWQAAVAAADLAGQLTAGQIGAGIIGTTHLSAGSVTTSKLGAGAVTAAKIPVTSLDAISANLGSITVGRANPGNAAVGEAQIDNLTVSRLKIKDYAVSSLVVTTASSLTISATPGTYAVVTLAIRGTDPTSGGAAWLCYPSTAAGDRRGSVQADNGAVESVTTIIQIASASTTITALPRGAGSYDIVGLSALIMAK